MQTLFTHFLDLGGHLKTRSEVALRDSEVADLLDCIAASGGLELELNDTVDTHFEAGVESTRDKGCVSDLI